MSDAAIIEVNGEGLEASPMGAIYWAAQRMLIVADIHLEKGSSFARRGVLLPPYDTRTTLRRLKALCDRYQPRRLVSLGDAFHDAGSESGMDADDTAALSVVIAGRTVIWVLGNHDPQPPQIFVGDTCTHIRIGALTLRHEPAKGEAPGEFAGHLHPCAKVEAERRVFRRRCFATDGARMVLPALGAYAGGLNLLDDAFAPLFAEPRAWVLGAKGVYPVARSALRADPEPAARLRSA